MFTTNNLGVHVLSIRPDSSRYWRQGWRVGDGWTAYENYTQVEGVQGQNIAHRIAESGKEGEFSTHTKKLRS